MHRYTPDEITAYGDVRYVADGWVRIPLRQSRNAPQRFTIVTGWEKTRYGYRPKKAAVVPQDWWAAKLARAAASKPLPPEVLAERRRKAALRRAEREAQEQREYEEYLGELVAAYARARGYQPEDLAGQLRVLRRHPDWAERVIRELRDLREASPQWLEEALTAAEQNRDLGGKAYRAFREGEIELYEFLRLSLGAHRRHELTSYDSLLARGVDRDLARDRAEEELRQQST